MSGAEIFAAAMAIMNVIGVPVFMKLFKDIRDADKSATAALALALEGKELSVDALDKLNQHKLHVAQDYISLAAFEKFETRLFNDIEIIKTKLDAKADKA